MAEYSHYESFVERYVKQENELMKRSLMPSEPRKFSYYYEILKPLRRGFGFGLQQILPELHLRTFVRTLRSFNHLQRIAYILLKFII